ncbi:SAM-dependent methyltransferase [Paraburkholderia sp. GAS41]|uniref:hypothetical protein n=1 Tax=Paraburkholderia sp. GAS41 TaxID=3035134 RepID=UPI003D25C738
MSKHKSPHNKPNPLRTVAAVYRIVAPDGRFYLGASKRVGRRFSDHRSKGRRGCHENVNLQASFDTHGIDAHQFVLLARVYELDKLEATEQTWLSFFLDECPEKLLNRSPTAGKANTGIRRTESVKAARRGEGNANASLSAASVAAIRSTLSERGSEWGLRSKLAREHGVCTATISKIERGQRWGSISPVVKEALECASAA